MSVPIRVSDKIFSEAKKAGKARCRSAAQQIDFWARVAKAAEDNPDLPVSFVADILEGLDDPTPPTEFKFQHEDN